MTLIIIKSAPTLDLEPIELLLASSAFDQSPQLLLMQEGIFHASTLQQEKRPQGKSAGKLLSALPMYDCGDVYVSKKDIVRYSLDEQKLQPFCILVDDKQIQDIISNSKHCVSF